MLEKRSVAKFHSQLLLNGRIVWNFVAAVLSHQFYRICIRDELENVKSWCIDETEWIQVSNRILYFELVVVASYTNTDFIYKQTIIHLAFSQTIYVVWAYREFSNSLWSTMTVFIFSLAVSISFIIFWTSKNKQVIEYGVFQVERPLEFSEFFKTQFNFPYHL